MRDYQKKLQKRVGFIKDVLKKSEASGSASRGRTDRIKCEIFV